MKENSNLLTKQPRNFQKKKKFPLYVEFGQVSSLQFYLYLIKLSFKLSLFKNKNLSYRSSTRFA